MTQCILDDLRHDSGTGMRHDRGSMISFAEQSRIDTNDALRS
jgi:hypothetical protein